MADVRSMLRAERANRRITHPHASYTLDGKLLCNLCETPVKSEAQWQSHLHSSQHILRSQREKDASVARAAPNSGSFESKKRKADELESSPQDERKKAKATARKTARFQVEPADDKKSASSEVVDALSPDQTSAASTPPPTAQPDDADDEYAAFEREIAALEQEQEVESAATRVTGLNTEATISAAPITIEQMAADAREEQSAQRSKHDVELEADREDAARVLEEEFEEMEGFEERVRKLRERREALRQANSDSTKEDVEGETNPDDKQSQDEDSDYDDDDWQFGGG